jgi:hypothetical protein
VDHSNADVLLACLHDAHRLICDAVGRHPLQSGLNVAVGCRWPKRVRCPPPKARTRWSKLPHIPFAWWCPFDLQLCLNYIMIATARLSAEEWPPAASGCECLARRRSRL